jgi:hypothetical protein
MWRKKAQVEHTAAPSGIGAPLFSAGCALPSVGLHGCSGGGACPKGPETPSLCTDQTRVAAIVQIKRLCFTHVPGLASFLGERGHDSRKVFGAL